jgi:hypothetical protein
VSGRQAGSASCCVSAAYASGTLMRWCSSSIATTAGKERMDDRNAACCRLAL